MGTTYSVKVARAPDTMTLERLAALCTEVLERVDARMSTYRGDSELVRFNRSDSTDWIPVSAETASVAAEALVVSELSGGAFDPTVGPLVQLWGFGPAPAQTIPPPADRIARTLERIGFRYLEVREQPAGLRKQLPGVELDLSAVAKGYAVDALAAALTAEGAQDFLLEIGGELRAAGRNLAGWPWQVAVEKPALERAQVQAVVGLDDAAIATSGSYRNFHVRGEIRFSHVLDPRSGRPLQDSPLSVSVIAGTAARADALATALLVLGAEAGWALAQRERLAVLFLRDTPHGLEELSTEAFDRFRTKPRPGG